MKLKLCSNCKETETYRKCSECGKISICIICEINHKHKKPINQVAVNHRESIPNSDLEKAVIIDE